MKNKKYINIIYYIILTIILTIILLFKNKYTSYEDAGKYIHFSIDDTIEIFKDLTVNKDKYDTIFDNKTLKALKQCNEIFGAKFSIYCFYEFNDFCLKDCTSKFVSEFEQNNEWLKFGFHALNNNRDYQTLSEKEIQDDYVLLITLK